MRARTLRLLVAVLLVLIASCALHLSPPRLRREATLRRTSRKAAAAGDAGSDGTRATTTTATTTTTTTTTTTKARVTRMTITERTRGPVFTHGGQVPVGQALRYAHMSTAALVRTRNHTHWLVAFQGSKWYEGADDQRIYVTTSKDGANAGAFTPPVEAIPSATTAQWSPVLWTDPQDDVWLFFTQSTAAECMRPPDGKKPALWAPGGDIYAATLRKDGVTFGKPRLLHAQSESRRARGSPKVLANPPVVVGQQKKRWVLPFWRETRTWPEGCLRHADGESAGVLVSDDHGETWRPRGHIAAKETHLIEGTLATDSLGTLHQFFRTSTGNAYASTSRDRGETWSQPKACLDMRNADAKAQLLVHEPTGTLLAAYNDHGPQPSLERGHEGCRKCRTRLIIAASEAAHAPCERAWQPLARVVWHHTTYLRAHYPSMVFADTGGAELDLFVWYTTLYACCAPPNATLGVSFVRYAVGIGLR